MTDMINHPPHYTAHPSGVETIDLTRYLDFCRGNAVKYICRYEHKGTPGQDIQKALFYINTAMDSFYDRDLENLGLFTGDFRESLAMWYNEEKNVLVASIVAALCASMFDTTVWTLKIAQSLCQELLNEVQSNDESN